MMEIFVRPIVVMPMVPALILLRMEFLAMMEAPVPIMINVRMVPVRAQG
jgi:hypothetical protein